MHLAQNWETRSIVPYKTINTMNHPLKLMLTNEIRPIMAELEKKMHLKTVKGQLRNYFESSMEPVRCWEVHGQNIEATMATVLGGMAAQVGSRRPSTTRPSASSTNISRSSALTSRRSSIQSTGPATRDSC